MRTEIKVQLSQKQIDTVMNNFSINIVDQQFNCEEQYNPTLLMAGMGCRYPLRINSGTPEVSSCTYLESLGFA